MRVATYQVVCDYPLTIFLGKTKLGWVTVRILSSREQVEFFYRFWIPYYIVFGVWGLFSEARYHLSPSVRY